ncbi:MAG TPA: sulfotransferase [Sphingomicrobium sp.]|nr:sulfotransferase [Sphingomicrobium sp.]
MDARFRQAVGAFQRGDLEAALAIATGQANSTDPEWQHLLGLIECRRGNLSAGVAYLQSASDAEPDNPAFRLMLARALVDCGRAAEVLAMPEPAALPLAANVALWQIRAEAAARLDDATALAQAWRSIAAATPNDGRAWINLGRSLLQQDAFAEAADAYRKALALTPTNLDALHELALLYERTNDLQAMADLLDSALADGIAKDRLAFAWALLEQRLGNAQEARRLLDLPGADRDRTRWYRLLATAEDELGNSSAAFAATIAMNRSARGFDDWRRRGLAYRQELRDLAEAIAGWSDLPSLPPLDDPPIFLVGFPRSGTTLADTFLMGHPEIEVLEELPLLSDVAAFLGSLRNLPRVSASSMRQARDRYLRDLAAALPTRSARRIVDKFPLNMVAAPVIHGLFPGAPIIFVQRHPCDCVLSGFMQAFVSNVGNASFLDIADAAEFYDACMSVWAACEAVLPLNVHTIRYESLVIDPEAELRPLMEHIGLGFDERMLDHRKTANARGAIPNTSYNQVVEPLSAAPVLRWRRYAKELEPVLPALLPWAERLGYES